MPRHETGDAASVREQTRSDQKGETLKRPYLYCGCVKTSEWQILMPTNTILGRLCGMLRQTELLWQFHPRGALEGGVLSGSHRESEGTADAARDIARSPFGHEPTPILHEPRTQAHGHSQCVELCSLGWCFPTKIVLLLNRSGTFVNPKLLTTFP